VIGSFQGCELLNQWRSWGVIDRLNCGQLDHEHRWRMIGASGHSSRVIDLQGQGLLDLGYRSRVIGSRLASLRGSADRERIWQAQVPQRIDKQPPQVAGHGGAIPVSAVQDRGLLLHLQAEALTQPVCEFGVGHQQQQVIPQRAVGCVQHGLDGSGGGNWT
jgi:hypothetical protein